MAAEDLYFNADAWKLLDCGEEFRLVNTYRGGIYTVPPSYAHALLAENLDPQAFPSDLAAALLKIGVLAHARPARKATATRCSRPPLRKLILHVDDACNLECKHCYVPAISPPGRLSYEEIVRVLDDYANMGG